MMNSAIAENYQSGFGSYFGTASIENKINSLMKYNPLEMQLNQLQPLAEPEDPPETLHTPWGIWLHWRDPLHKIHQRFDTEHVIRTTKAAEDILHYAHYVPIIEGPEHEHIHSYQMNFAYEYVDEMQLYNFSAEIDDTEGLNAEDVEILHAVESENAVDLEHSISEEPEEFEDDESVEQMEISQRKDIPSNEITFEKQLLRIFESLFGLNKSNSGG